jgi:hypothetical protein
LKRVLQEKRVENPEYTISKLVNIAHVRERAELAAARPGLNTMDSDGGKKSSGAGPSTKRCFFCKSRTHDDTECRKIKAKKAAGLWKERPGTKPGRE